MITALGKVRDTMFRLLKEKMKYVLSNEQGAVSLQFTVLILIMLFAFCAFIDEYKTTTTLTETEAILDLASVEALRYAVDEEEWNQGRLVIDEDLAKQKFVEILQDNISDGTAKNIESFEIVDGYNGIKITYDDTGLATGVHMSTPDDEGNIRNENVEVESYFLSCVVNVKYGVRKDTDFIGTVTTTFFNIFTDETQSASSANSAKDGFITTPIQVVGKITLQ